MAGGKGEGGGGRDKRPPSGSSELGRDQFQHTVAQLLRTTPGQGEGRWGGVGREERGVSHRARNAVTGWGGPTD